MPERSPNLDMPYIQPSQAQKHVTHNEAIQSLDAVAQFSVLGLGATTPPPAPAIGECWGLGPGATGEWAGHDGEIALRAETAWAFLSPREGWRVWDRENAAMMVYRGGEWAAPAFSRLGINATPDATNRLALASDATLFSHDGAGHQLKLNKNTAGDTASLLYQAGWTGHAEMGLTGSNNWSLKLSPDGSAWTEALTADATTGLLSGAAVQSAADDVTPGRLARADYAYGPGNLLGPVSQSGGAPTGAVIESGANANGEFTRFADGTMICAATLTHTDEAIATATGGSYRSDPISIAFPAGFSSVPAVSFAAGRTTNHWDAWAILQTASPTSFGCIYIAPTSRTQTMRLSYIAFGRWF